MLTKLMASMAD